MGPNIFIHKICLIDFQVFSAPNKKATCKRKQETSFRSIWVKFLQPPEIINILIFTDRQVRKICKKCQQQRRSPHLLIFICIFNIPHFQIKRWVWTFIILRSGHTEANYSIARIFFFLQVSGSKIKKRKQIIAATLSLLGSTPGLETFEKISGSALLGQENQPTQKTR